MNIPSTSINLATQNLSSPARAQQAPPAPPAEEGVTFRDVAAIGAGVVAGSAGAVVGLGEGLIKGGIKAYPKHIGEGAKIGREIAAPVGTVVGGAAAIAAIGGAAVAAPALTVMAAAGGAINGTLSGAYIHGQTEVPKAIEAGTQWGESALGTALKTVGGAIGGTVGALLTLPTIIYPPLGKELIPEAFAKGKEWGGAGGEAVGEFLGGAVGGLGGAVAGGATSLVKGLPDGYQMGKDCARETSQLITELPSFAKHAWTAGTQGGAELAGDLGSMAGGTTGFITATGATVLSGIDTSIERATGWAGSASDFVRGDKAGSEPDPTEVSENG